MRVWRCGALVAAALAACSAPRTADRPAVIVAADAVSRAELERTLAQALGVERVTVAPDAFTRDSMLAFERRDPAAPGPRIATGRTLEEPARVRLVLRDARCILVSEADGREWPLGATRCVAVEGAPQLE